MSDKPVPQRRGPIAFSRDAQSLLQKHLAARGFEDAHLVTHWPIIVGASLAAHCLPHKLTTKGDDGATLTLIADDRAALELQHQSLKLVDKINTYFGRTVVKKTRIIAGEIPQAARPAPPPRPLSAEQEDALAHETARIEDAELRAAFERLGRETIGRGRRTATGPTRS
jgi:hypothetical protein